MHGHVVTCPYAEVGSVPECETHACFEQNWSGYHGDMMSSYVGPCSALKPDVSLSGLGNGLPFSVSDCCRVPPRRESLLAPAQQVETLQHIPTEKYNLLGNHVKHFNGQVVPAKIPLETIRQSCAAVSELRSLFIEVAGCYRQTR
eukprot:2530432-Karenia_brevis.AAC.1